MPTRAPAILAALAAGGLFLFAGCGSSAPTKTQHIAKTNVAKTNVAKPSAHTVHTAIVGENHDPTVNRPWSYTVTVTDASGNRLSGTETTQYTFHDLVVGTEHPENVRFTGGIYRDTVEFPAAAIGHPLAVQAVVHTRVGAATVDWPVEVHR
ncbi:MAG TPA: hypothetical protein VNV37_08505 [Solirubrobacteraceae bacterium]|jgi:hypothetical protein|nr:hypothetical protein [Solirubrobacteraceae bacterium]